MKKNILFLLLLITTLSAEISLQEIDMMIDKIKKPRDGILLEALSKTPDPFKQQIVLSEGNTTETIISKKDKDFSLNAIMNGKAFIDGEWRIKDDVVSDYTVVFIGKKGVVLARERNIIKLFLEKKEHKIFIIIKGR